MILYKYFSNSINSFKALAVRGLWCDIYKNMNDPFECLAKAERNLSKKQIQGFRKYLQNSSYTEAEHLIKFPDKDLLKLLNEARIEALQNIAFTSLSESFDDILLWSHYASSHTGFVIGLEFQEPSSFYSQKNGKHILEKVKYVDTLNANIDYTIFAKLLEFDENNIGEKDRINIREVVKDFSTKSKAWAYEREWRIWSSERNYYFLEPNSIKEVYIGINCPWDVVSIIVSLFSAHKQDEVPMWQMSFADHPVRLMPSEEILLTH